MVKALHREMFPVDARLNDPVDRLQKISTMGLNVEPDQVGAQQPVHQFALPWTNSEGLRIRPRDMPENGHARIRPFLLDQPGQ